MVLLALLAVLCGAALAVVDPSVVGALVSEPGQTLEFCGTHGINVCQFTISTNDQVVSSISFSVSLSAGGTIYTDPGSSSFSPPNPRTCNSYITSGVPTLALEESFSQFVLASSRLLNGSFTVQSPLYREKTNAMVLQLAYTGTAVASARFFFISPSQVFWDGRATCGPGTARVQQLLCPAVKNSDLSGDGLVNIVDVVLMLDVWGLCGVTSQQCMLADLDCSGTVDLFDIARLLASWKTAK